MDLVSVIIPTFNRANVIKRAIESALNQTYENIEIIIIDDGSMDNTDAIIGEIMDDRIRYYKNGSNVGPSEARNIGVQYARGEWIAFLDSDDEWFPDKLERQIEKYKEDDYGLVYCPYMYSKDSREFQTPSKNLKKEEVEGYIYTSILRNNTIGTPTILMKKDVFQSCGGFDKEIKAFEDWDLALAVAKDFKIGYVSEPLVKAHFSENSVNYNHANLTYGCLRMLYKNRSYVGEKSMLESMIRKALEHAACCQEDYKDMFVPSLISGDMEYQLLIDSYKKMEVWKKKYRAMAWIQESLKDFIKNETGKFVIYGAGIIGQTVYQHLINENRKVEYLLDCNKVVVNGIETNTIENLLGNSVEATCIITIPDNEKKIENMIINNFHWKVVNICNE